MNYSSFEYLQVTDAFTDVDQEVCRYCCQVAIDCSCDPEPFGSDSVYDPQLPELPEFEPWLDHE